MVAERLKGLFLHIDYNSSEPIYRQAVEQIKLMVVSGTLRPGDRMPSIRELARSLKINPTTAAKIYNELAHEGILTLRQGQGAFVSERPRRLAYEEVRRIVADHARRMLVEGLRLGLTREQIEEIVEEEFRRIKGVEDGGERH
jgi:GntR family transcriptional regulator